MNDVGFIRADKGGSAADYEKPVLHGSVFMHFFIESVEKLRVNDIVMIIVQDVIIKFQVSACF